jgi:serine/threonine-protein kinase
MVLSILIVIGAGYGIHRALRNPAVNSAVNKGAEKVEPPNLVLIPGGSFQMGRSDVRSEAADSPAHQVNVVGFYMDRTEVTNSEYAVFVRQSGYRAPKGWNGNDPPQGREQWPVTDVSADDARAFAAWRSTRDGVKYRLPSEEEWEYAARGGARNLMYPWGNAWDPNRANLGTGAGDKVDFPKPVGSFPSGASPSGVLDLIGNVWEWTSTEARPYPGHKGPINDLDTPQLVVRGGAHQSMHPDAVKFRGGKEFPATFRYWARPDTRSPSIGFRLVQDAP